MKQWKLAGSTAVIAILAGTGAFAEVTPEDVWQNWQDLSASYGQTVTATSAERDGDTLVVSGVTISQDKDGVAVSGSIDELNFTDNGDGSVDITMSDSYPLLVVLPANEGAEPVDLKITLTQPDMVITASGSADALSYDFEAPTMVAKLEAINGVDASRVDATAEATLTNMTGSYLVEGDGEARNVTSDFAAESVKLVMSGSDDETKSDVNLTASIANLASNSTGTFLGAEAMADFAAALKAGFAVNGNISYGATSFDVAITEAGAPSKVSGTLGGGDISFAMDANRMQYGGAGKAVAVSITSPDIPFPELKMAYDEAAFNFLMPVAKTDAPSDFALLTKLVGLTVSDEVWGMFDPAGNLPRDPATVVIDTKGKVKLTTDLLDEAAMAAIGEAPPGELHALDITELKASIAGAELTGSGALTFDNSDLTTFQGVPVPTGKVDLKLVGGSGLLDKIVAMGLMTQDDAMGFKMMVSMFANSAPDKDEMTSTLEFKDKGFYANGQKLQ